MVAAYDTADFVADCSARGIARYVAMKITEWRDTALDRRTSRHSGYVASQRIRKRIEECFAGAKDGRPLSKIKVYGKDKVSFLTTLTVGCYTLLRWQSSRPPPGWQRRRSGVGEIWRSTPIGR